MQRIETEIEIAATAARVWSILADFAAYPTWNPFVRNIAGRQEAGAGLTVTIQPEGGRAMSFTPRLIEFRNQAEIRWKGRVLLPGIFDGEHYFLLTELDPRRVLFRHGEVFAGLLVPLIFRGTMKTGTERGFLAMNRALKRRAENA